MNCRLHGDSDPSAEAESVAAWAEAFPAQVATGSKAGERATLKQRRGGNTIRWR